MAAKKKTTTQRNSSGKASEKKQSLARTAGGSGEAADLSKDVILWVVVAVSVLLFLSNLGLGGVIGNVVSGVFFGVFGLIAYLFPLMLLLGTFFAVSNRNNRVAMVKLVAAFLFMVFLCVLIELIAYGKDTATTGVVQFFYDSRDNKIGGGFLGGLIGGWLCKGFGLVGAYVVTAALLIISLVLITEKSAVKKMQQHQEQMKTSAMQRKMERQERQEKIIRDRQRQLEALKEDRAKPRRKRKVEGVAFDTQLTEEVPVQKEHSDEVNEVKINIFDEDVEVAECSRVPLKANTVPIESAPSPREDQPQKPPEKQQAAAAAEPAESKNVSAPSLEPSKKPVSDKDMIHSQTQEVAESVAAASSAPTKKYQFPPVSLLKKQQHKGNGNTKTSLKETADKLQQTLKNFGVNVSVTDVSCGPSVTRYELQPEMGVKVSKIVNLADDIKLNLAAADIRIEAPIPGKAAVGIEVPNKEKVMVSFRELVESSEFSASKSNISFAVGRDIAGQIIISNIAKMPHLLIAGATGSGKSVCINTIIMSILYKADPSDVKFIMIDPKVVELSIYNGIPHLLIPVVTDPKKAAGALHWAVTEMMDRYQKFADAGVKDMQAYNEKIVDGVMKIQANGETQEVATPKMPQIVIVVDELADLMMVAAGDVEEAICRLAQLARAAGIHLIIATQRPSVNVITGLIKANMPSRIAFSVTSGVDSRTILDMGGAEKLLGNGDMLYYPQGFTKPLRVQGAFVSETEVQKVVQFLTKNNASAEYDQEIQEKIAATATEDKSVAIGSDNGFSDSRDPYFEAAGRLIVEKEKGSIGMLQRNFKVGFNRAARIMDQLEEAGVVGPEEGTKPRRVLVSMESFEELLSNN